MLVGRCVNRPLVQAPPRGTALICALRLRPAWRQHQFLNRRQCRRTSFESTGQDKRGRCAKSHCFSSADVAQAQVVLTREAGKNGKLQRALEQQGISVLELPLVETSSGPQRRELPAHLKAHSYDWVVITSPEAANVFLQGWSEADKPQIRIAVVGQGTGEVIQSQQENLLQIEYTPTKANAVSLSAELPHVPGGTDQVLYPSSAKAGSDLQTGLTQRGFDVVRLNTYDTQPVSQIRDSKLVQALQADVVAVASPSAIKAWRRLIQDQDLSQSIIACIGSTTAIAAEKQGFTHVFFPEQPGIDGFVAAIKDALDFAHQQSAVQMT